MLGIVGSSTLIECAVNHKYYESKGFYVIGAGIAPECYATPNIAAVNMGARYSSDGAAQYLIRQGVKKLVFDQSNVPGTGYNAGGVELIAKEANIPVQLLKDNVPIQDANSVAIKLVQAAGDGRRGRAQLHPAGGAEDPPGRAAPRPAGPGQVGAARRRATPTSSPRRSGPRGTASWASTPSST